MSRSNRRQLTFPSAQELEGPILQVEDLHTSFVTDRGLVRAVDGVSFELDQGTNPRRGRRVRVGKDGAFAIGDGAAPVDARPALRNCPFLGPRHIEPVPRRAPRTCGERRSRWCSRTR